MGHPCINCLDERIAALEAERDEALAALCGLLIEDPHDLEDTRPCDTCAKGHAVLDKANNYQPHKADCHCVPCRLAYRKARAARDARESTERPSDGR